METVQNQYVVGNNDVPSSSKFTWRIENVSTIDEENHLSPIFTMGLHKWRLLAFRRGSNVDGYLSLYVVAVECTDSRHVKFSLALVDQTNNQKANRKDTGDRVFRFTEDENDWGFDDFIELEELKDPRKGYIVNDACIVEVELCLSSAQESREELVPDELMESVEERDPVTNSTLPASTSGCLDICAFCQTSEETEESGSMLHIFANGKEVEEDEVSGPNVIHVHRICLEWTPQVYYVGETLMNLEVELARGSKLKCSCCGLKGAVLGCFITSCKNTYHVPCAFGTSGCRWYDEGYLMLCPSHCHMKFPHEKTKKKKKLAKGNSSTVHRYNFILLASINIPCLLNFGLKDEDLWYSSK
ncbi:hypothetical protein MKW94_029516 [Papaver nudicaule]|uniref:MATH domain-containing protein n=1 Tax=Papaver nudicaule TaxID=74823 RepID=A0AA41VLV1_PAPNU|nr:hypothetical protein [Papaver nudicaule]